MPVRLVSNPPRDHAAPKEELGRALPHDQSSTNGHSSNAINGHARRLTENGASGGKLFAFPLTPAPSSGVHT
eukprot:209307-Rhodomonas_salina.1